MFDWIPLLFFVLFGGISVGCALSMVVQRNPLYSAISLIGVFVSLACLYVMLAAPFIAAVQVIVYAGAIMVLVVFVIMLLNVEEEEVRRPLRLRYLLPVAVALAFVLVAEVAFMLSSVERQYPVAPAAGDNVGSTLSIGSGLFTEYLLPFEITSVLILMAIVGAMTLARRTAVLSPTVRVVPGAQVLTRQTVDPRAVGDATPVESDTTAEAARLMGVGGKSRKHDGE